jgi:hypothetical protein
VSADDRSRKLVRAEVGHQYPDVVRIATRDEGDPAALEGVDPATMSPKSRFQHLKILGAVDRPDQVLLAHSAREMPGLGSLSDQIDLEAVRSQQERSLGGMDAQLTRERVSVELNRTIKV